jgi:hypothetical protein
LWRIRSALLVLVLGTVLPVSAAFEINGQGARSTGLGGAFIAVTEAAEAAWFNPASNARMRRLQVSSSHALLYSGLEDSPSLNALAVVAPVAGGGLHLAFSALGGKDWNEEVVVVGYGRALHRRLAAGIGASSLGWRTTGRSQRKVSVDVGMVYEVGWVHPQAYVQVAGVAKNLNRANVAAGGQAAGRMPRILALGVGVLVAGQRILLDVERRDGRTEIRTGYEVRAASLWGTRFRFGGRVAASEWQGREMDVGFGHGWQQWQVDYAYTYPLQLEGLGGIHRISLGYSRR